MPVDQKFQRGIATGEWFCGLAEDRKTDPRHFAPVASILGRTERLGFDRLALKVGFKLQDRGVQTFQVWDHLAELHASVRFRLPGITGWAQVNGFRGEADNPPPIQWPACPACGQMLRLTTLEPHERYANLDVRNFACNCGFTTSDTMMRP